MLLRFFLVPTVLRGNAYGYRFPRRTVGTRKDDKNKHFLFLSVFICVHLWIISFFFQCLLCVGNGQSNSNKINVNHKLISVFHVLKRILILRILFYFQGLFRYGFVKLHHFRRKLLILRMPVYDRYKTSCICHRFF